MASWEEDVWRLKIPIRLSLSPSEISTPVDVKPVYLLASRQAYLPALAEQCLSHFQHVLLSLPGQALGSPWFECQGLALSWTQPLGVLYDLLVPTVQQQPEDADGAAAAGGVAAPAGPWCLTVHYRNTPASLCNSWQNVGTAKEHFLSSMKEAGYCCRGSDGAAAVMRLPGALQDELWAAVNRGDSRPVRQQLSSLRLAPTPRQGSGVSCVPVRLYIRRHSQDSEGLAGVWEQTYSSSRPVDVCQPDGTATLLAHVAHLVMPLAFAAPISIRQPAATASTAAAPQAEAAHAEQAEQQQQQPQRQQAQSTGDAAGLQQEPLPPEPAGHKGTGGGDAAAAASDTMAAGSTPAADADDAAPAAGAGAGAAAAAEAPTTAAGADGAGLAGGTGGPSGVDEAAGAAGSGQAVSLPAPASVLLPPGWPCATVYVCGVQCDWRTPLVWLHTHLQAADCFLYVVVHLV